MNLILNDLIGRDVDDRVDRNDYLVTECTLGVSQLSRLHWLVQYPCCTICMLILTVPSQHSLVPRPHPWGWGLGTRLSQHALLFYLARAYTCTYVRGHTRAHVHCTCGVDEESWIFESYSAASLPSKMVSLQSYTERLDRCNS